MKLFKKITLVIVISTVLSLLGGYFYFDQKFTPPENDLNVSGFTKDISMRWVSSEENPYSATLLPVQIKGIDKTFYMQLDSGSPITLFYKKSLESIQSKLQHSFKFNTDQNQISIHFNIGTMSIVSDHFKVLNYGNIIDLNNPNAENIIGTIGTDLLERRVTILDFKNNLCSFVEDIKGEEFTEFEFKKRKIIFPATIGDEKLKLLYDSGTSGYELITNKEEWEKYKTQNSKPSIEKGNSWGNMLTVISAATKNTIKIGNQDLKLSEVTYVEGTSQIQNLLMKTSGMQGMIGNKLFLNHKLILDCKNKKFKVE
ncbi:hypothetical protein [Flavobacterium sp. '19STA2R22 D10 B1']|uniref:hypothetical protein n=1 Tax=Flavobacterium aerium TaxID=3037261 RepID=UPI00278C5ABF|nr:hypothetical protein [Flavobacterium sp. '19STA2R22 D10 B1']